MDPVSISNVDDVIYHKFLGGKINIIISLICALLLLFQFTGIGLWVSNLFLGIIINTISTFTFSFWGLFEVFSMLFLIIPVCLVFFFCFIPFYIFSGLVYIPLIFIYVRVSRLLKILPQSLQELLVYEKWKRSEREKHFRLKQTNNYLDQQVINKVLELNQTPVYYRLWLLKEDTLEYIEAFSKSKLDEFEIKLNQKYSLLNSFLIYFGSDINSPNSYSCSHGFAKEIYCKLCHQYEKDEYEKLTQFLKKYKAQSAKEKSTKKPFKGNSSYINYRNLLELTEPYTLKELKEKRNLALKRNHPDLVSGMSIELQNLAKSQTQEIIKAYDKL